MKDQPLPGDSQINSKSIPTSSPVKYSDDPTILPTRNMNVPHDENFHELNFASQFFFKYQSRICTLILLRINLPAVVTNKGISY
jgi:hypothetical protein